MKKYSMKFWVTFWVTASILLATWFIFLEYKNKSYSGIVFLAKPIIKIMPIQYNKKNELIGIIEVLNLLSKKREYTFLLLFQNKDELRPGGGHIGSFSIVKIKNGKIIFIDIHDTNIFDLGTITQVKPSKLMQKYLNIENLRLGDSNWSPDFKINAKQADYLYHLEGGQEKIDGIIAISNKLLVSFLEVVGPVQIKDYPTVYNSKNVIEQLEYQIEKDKWSQNIKTKKQKNIMESMAKIIIKKIQVLKLEEIKKIFNKIQKHLNEKDIMIYFKDKKIQRKIQELGWSGEIKNSRNNDFLMMVDTNLGAKKSDAVIDRKFEYTVDFRRKKTTANLKIIYTHKGKVRDLLTDDYKTYLKILVPKKSWLYNSSGFKESEFIDFGKSFDKKSFGVFHKVNLGKTKIIEFKYYLPDSFSFEKYQLFIQKQSGINKLIGKVKIIDKMGIVKSYTVNSSKDVSIKIN